MTLLKSFQVQGLLSERKLLPDRKPKLFEEFVNLLPNSRNLSFPLNSEKIMCLKMTQLIQKKKFQKS